MLGTLNEIALQNECQYFTTNNVMEQITQEQIRTAITNHCLTSDTAIQRSNFSAREQLILTYVLYILHCFNVVHGNSQTNKN